MADILSAELAATCSALGYYDAASKKYFADENTLETVKDLIRYLRRDDENHDIRRQLGDTKVLQTDLLPMLKSYWEESELFDVLLRLLVNLTTPAIVLYNEDVPSEKITRNYYMQIVDDLKNYKEAFIDPDVWSVLSRRLSKTLETDYTERGDEKSLIIERILILLRNVLYVPIDPYLERPDDDASIHDQVLWSLHQSGMLDIILYLSSSPSEQAYYMHILEILCFMLREQKASDLANAALRRSETEKIRDEAELLATRHREARQKQQKIKKYTGARHSRFGGTFVVKSMKSISDNYDLLYHKPLNTLEELNFDAEKKKPKTPKNRLPVSCTTFERRSAFSIRLILKEFCIEFLNGAYNVFVNYVKNALVRGKGQNNDESYYFWAVRFFMEMNRCYKFDIKLVSETVSIQTFHFIQREMEKQFDIMQTDKRTMRFSSRRLHLALLAYRELLLTLCAMDRSSDDSVRNSAKVIKSNLFYIPEYRELVLTLLVTYDELKSSDLYLKDLIETQHVFLRMLEKFCGKTGSVVVQNKSKGRRKKKKTANKSKLQPNLDVLWVEVGPQLTAILETGNDFPSDIAPFDAGSDVPIDDQKADAMKKIQRKLRDGDFEGATGLLHASREVWPDDDEFGNHNMSKEEEFLALKDIFFANIGNENELIAVESSEEDDDEEDFGDSDIRESEIKVEDFTKRLAHPKIVKACGLALNKFESNSINTNNCIVKLLHRIAFDCKMYVMLFQLSIFRIFQRIYKTKELPQYKELVKFATYIVRQFFKVSAKNKKVYIETIFWKSSREAYEIEEGYDSQPHKSTVKAWTEEEEDELRRLFMEHREKQIEEDVVDWIVDNLIDNTRSRRLVLLKLKELMLITNNRSKSTVRVAREWGADEEEQLQDLFLQFRNASDPVGCIIERLSVRRPKNRIVEKLLVMGLIQDRKEIYKKRGKKSKNTEEGADESDQSIETDREDISDDEQSQNQNRSFQPKVATAKRNDTRRKSSKKTTVRKGTSKLKLVKLLLEIEDELAEALDWLKDCLSDALEAFEDEDYDDDTDISLPLVPIMDYAVEAMENDKFLSLLKAMGIVEPDMGQEIYWRVPQTTSANTLRENIELLTQAIDKTLSLPEEPVQNQAETDDISEPSTSGTQKNLEEKVEKIFAERHLNLRFTNNDSDEDIEENVEEDSSSPQEQNGQTESESGTPVSPEGVTENTIGTLQDPLEDEPSQLSQNAIRKRSRKIIDSDSESDNSNENSVPENASEKERKDSESEDELVHHKRASKRLKIIDSDDEI